MTATLFGELTADARRIILVGAGEDDHDLNQLAVRLDTITPHWTQARDEHGNETGAISIPATYPAVVQIGHTFTGNGSGAWVPQPKLLNWIADQAARRMLKPPAIGELWPAGRTPRDYQLENAAAIASLGKVLLLDEPGLGKTVSALLGAEARRKAGHDIFPMVIVVPSWEVGDVWARHIADWMPHWPEPVFHKGDKRGRVAGWRDRHYVLITTYATARRDARHIGDLLPKLRPAAVIADECHLIKNRDAQQSKAVERIAKRSGMFIGCSGTLITHNMGDIYQVLFTMDPESYPAWERFKPRYLATRRADDAVIGLRPEMVTEFFACLDGQILRHAKADVLRQLPPKIYSVRRPEMPADWRRAYVTMRDQMLAELPDGGELPVMDTLAQLTRLSQLASSAADVEIEYRPDEETGLLKPHYTVTLMRPCWKAESLLGILAERPGMPVAVFAESRQLIMLAGEYCREAGYRTGYVVGPGDSGRYGEPGLTVTSKTRKQAVADFQDGKLDVILCTAGAGGLGITLTASNCAVMMQRSFQLDLAVQPEDRVHRIGAEIHDHVEIIDQVTQGTIDQYRRKVLKGKAAQYSELIKDPRFVRELLGGLT